MSINTENLIDGNAKTNNIDIGSENLCPACHSELRRINGKHGWFWSCTSFRDGCKFTTQDNEGKPVGIYNCPKCDRRLRRLQKEEGFFWGCSGFREGCKTSFNDNNGEPLFQKKNSKKN